MQEAADATAGGMVTIIGLEKVQVEEICKQARQGEVLEIANLLAPDVCVVSGTNWPVSGRPNWPRKWAR